MEQISTASIIVENRFRRDMGDLEPLKASMTTLGLLQPIGIGKDRHLVFGGRRLEAARQLGWATIAAKVVDCDALIAEHDENEMRKGFTVSERVAIAEAVAERLAQRVGINQHTKEGKEIFPYPTPQGQTRDLAAAKAGLGSGKTLEAAQSVIERGLPTLVEAMDEGKVTIHAAKMIATLPQEEQAEVDFANPREVKKAANKGRARIARASGPTEPVAKQAEPPQKPVPDEARLYEPDSSLSALVLSHRAKTAIAQISKNDPNALVCIESIRTALDRQLHLITTAL